MDKFVEVPRLVWIALVALTVLAVAICEGQWLGTYSSLVIVLIAAAKGRLIILHYMEAKHAAPHWRFLYETWNFSATAIIIIGHYVTLAKVG
jgi:hypothetical protein